MFEIFKYGIVGVVGTLIHSGVLITLVEWGGFSPVMASMPAFICALLVSHYANHNWTFNHKVKPIQTFVKYFLVSIGGFLMNLMLMYLTVNLLRWPYLYGLVIVIFFVSTSNYTLNRFWTFRA